MNPDWLSIHDDLFAAFGPQHWWPGDTPFEVMAGAVLTQNTAWTNVELAIGRLKAAGALNGAAILGMPGPELAQLIRPAGFFNVKSRRLQALCAYLQDEGVLAHPERLAEAAPLPELRRRLLAVHGVGEETADSILLYALGLPAFVTDAYTRRIFTRLGLLRGDEPYAGIQSAFTENLPRRADLYNEHHALIVRLGKEYCRPAPRCGGCPLRFRCPGGS